MQQKRCFERDGRISDAARHGHEGENLRLVCASNVWSFKGADAGAHKVCCRHRFYEKIRDPQLHQNARCGSVKLLRHNYNGSGAVHTPHQALQRLNLVEAARIHVDDHNALLKGMQLGADLGDALLNGRERGRVKSCEGGLRRLDKFLVH